jgi:hypothetical protein
MITVIETIQSVGNPPVEIQHKLDTDMDLVIFLARVTQNNELARAEFNGGSLVPFPFTLSITVQYPAVPFDTNWRK